MSVVEQVGRALPVATPRLAALVGITALEPRSLVTAAAVA